MYRPTLRRQALRLGLLATLVVLALNACTGGQEQADRPRPLPEDEKALRPGEYRSEEFKPSLSFRVGKGWSSTPSEASDLLHIMRGETAGLIFAVINEVYKPSRTGSPDVVEVPKNLVGWLQHHPYLQTSKPEPITVGGVKGKQFDVVVEDLPEDYYGVCGQDCVDMSKVADGRVLFQPKGERTRLIVLEDVEGETVTVALHSQTTEFDEFTPEAQKVVASVKWTSS
jgi:mRNA-degrading endonuclease HigB of HigAB toxin-antitoxin module